LLPFETCGEVRKAVKTAIEDAEGRILIGSSTQIGESVPLKNFAALQEGLEL
jgi:hypothetical protein